MIAVSVKVEGLSTILTQKYKGKSRGRRSKLRLKMNLYMESGSHGGSYQLSYHYDPIESGCQGGFPGNQETTKLCLC